MPEANFDLTYDELLAVGLGSVDHLDHAALLGAIAKWQSTQALRCLDVLQRGDVSDAMMVPLDFHRALIGLGWALAKLDAKS